MIKKQFFGCHFKHYLAVSILTLGFSSTATAAFTDEKELKAYMGLGVTGFKAEIKDTDDGFYYGSEKYLGGTFRLGTPILNYLSIEGRYSFGKKNNKEDNISTKSGVASGLLLLGPTQGKYRPYLAVGASRVDIKISEAGETVKAYKITPSYGVGLALYTRKPDVGLSFEYLQVADSKFEYKDSTGKAEQKTTLGTLSITVIKHF